MVLTYRCMDGTRCCEGRLLEVEGPLFWEYAKDPLHLCSTALATTYDHKPLASIYVCSSHRIHRLTRTDETGKDREPFLPGSD